MSPSKWFWVPGLLMVPLALSASACSRVEPPRVERVASHAAAATVSVCVSGCDHTELSDAVAAASPDDVIDIGAGTYTVAGLSITKNLTLRGAGRTSTILQAAGSMMAASDRVVDISGAIVTIQSLTLRHGNSSGSGGAVRSDGNLIVDQVDVRSSSGTFGGCIYAQGTLSLTQVWLDNCTASVEGGAIYAATTTDIVRSTVSASAAPFGGGVSFGCQGGAPTLTVSQSTLSGNSTGVSDGAGIYACSGATVDIQYATVTLNTAASGTSGIYVEPTASVTIASSIVADNGASDCGGPATFISGNYNIFATGGGCTADGGADQLVAQGSTQSGLLSTLGANGGPTPTHVVSGIALDQIPSSTNGCGTSQLLDQRGVARPNGTQCDVGAVERGATVGSACASGADCDLLFCADGFCCNTACGGGVDTDCEACSAALTGLSDGTCGAALTGTMCRPASDVCDVAETCNGTALTCPADAKKFAGTVCRPAVDLCDVAETCDGVASACPANALRPSSFECRPSAGGCDPAETCTGSSATCPPDLVAELDTVCRPAVGTCDFAEKCDGVSTACPANLVSPVGTVCREVAGVCDVEETCDGIGGTCPADVLRPAGTVCRASSGLCDIDEVCTGTSADCPADHVRASSYQCRAAAGVCDIAEACDGINKACPMDARRPPSFVCRAAAGPCDLVENCDGTSVLCPPDSLQPPTYVCRQPVGLCDLPELCSGDATDCPPDIYREEGAVCRAAASVCDVDELCPGGTPDCPDDSFLAAGTLCRASEGPCDVPEYCTGQQPFCPTNALASSATLCRPAVGPCDTAERCTGSNVECPVDQLVAAGTQCQAEQCAAGVARSKAYCTGTGSHCPSLTVDCAPSTCAGTACKGDCVTSLDCATGSYCELGICRPRATLGELCSRDEGCGSGFCVDGVCCENGCGGIGTKCQACNLQGFEGRCTVMPPDAICRPSTGACDPPEQCDGMGTACPADELSAAGTPCRFGVDYCDLLEVCSGSSAACPSDDWLPNGTECPGGTCRGGQCTADLDASSDARSDVTDARSDALVNACLPNAQSCATLGPNGGSLALPGVTLVIPQGALATPLRVSVAPCPERTPAGYALGSKVYCFGPEGVNFFKPITVTFQHSGVSDPRVYWSWPSDPGAFEEVLSQVIGNTIVAHPTHFSVGFVAAAPAFDAGASDARFDGASPDAMDSSVDPRDVWREAEQPPGDGGIGVDSAGVEAGVDAGALPVDNGLVSGGCTCDVSTRPRDESRAWFCFGLVLVAAERRRRSRSRRV